MIGRLLSCAFVIACSGPATPPVEVPDVNAPTPSPTRASKRVDVSRLRDFPPAIHGMAVTSAGRLYFTDSFKTRELYYLDLPYESQPVPTGITGALPAGLLADGDALYVCDTGGGVVRKLGRDLAEVQSWTATSPWNIARLSTGTLITVSYDGAVQRLDTASASTLFADLDAPFGIAPELDGTFWLSEQGKDGPGRVTRRTLDGTIVETLPGTWDNPEGLFRDGNGALWIAETALGTLVRWHHGEAEIVGKELGMPVVIVGRDQDSLLVNSANKPAQLLAVEVRN